MTVLLFNEYECTTDNGLADAAAYAPGRRCVCTHQVAAVTSWPPSWPQIRNPTPSIDAYIYL